MSGSASGAIPASNSTTQLAQLISQLAPVFLGSGTTTKTTGPTTATSTGGQTSSSVGTTTSTIDPATLAALQGLATAATNNANNPQAATKDVVSNILRESAQAFTPVIAQQASSGLYNSTTLANLSTEARARATAAASSAVLNFQTGQQQIAASTLGTLANATKSTTSTNTGNTTTNNVTNQGPQVTAQITAPSVSPISSLLSLGGGVIANKLLGSKLVGGATDAAGDFLSEQVGNIGEALGVNLGNSTADLAASDAITQQGLTLAQTGNVGTTVGGVTVGENAAAPAITSAASDVSIAEGAPGAIFDIGGDIAGGAGAGAADLGGAAIGAAGVGDIAGAFGGTSAALDAGFASDAAIAGGAGAALGGGALLGTTAGGLVAEAGLTTAAAVDAGLISAGTAAAAEGGAAAAGAAAGGFAELLPELALALAWIVCTELHTQGKIPTSLYRYGALHFKKYPQWGRDGYYLWARPVVRYIRKYPNSWFTAIVAAIFLARVKYIAYLQSPTKYKFIMSGVVAFLAVDIVTASLGVLLLCARVTKSFGAQITAFWKPVH